MAMNRETKRMLQRQGQLGEDGAPAARRERRAPTAPRQAEREQRTKPAEFVREVRTELRKVAWPTRQETINYSIIVFVALAVLMAFVGLLDYVFGDFVLKLFNQ
jgi:preprotein translocase subunit SecE